MRRDPLPDPVLVGYLGQFNRDRRFRSLIVWCPHCQKWHMHGWAVADSPSIPASRAAHCHDGPFRQGGYYIRPFLKKELAAMAEAAEETQRVARITPPTTPSHTENHHAD